MNSNYIYDALRQQFAMRSILLLQFMLMTHLYLKEVGVTDGITVLRFLSDGWFYEKTFGNISHKIHGWEHYVNLISGLWLMLENLIVKITW